ncbi:hypothetical protein EP7_002403 [Isosphaeraceae bacterium EP7]
MASPAATVPEGARIGMEIGCHLTQINSYISAIISPDILAAQCSRFQRDRITSTLAEAHKVGSGTFVVADPGVFSGTIPYTGGVSEDTAYVRDSGASNGGVSRGMFSFRYRLVEGSNLLVVKEIKGRELPCDAGSQIDRFGMHWNNPEMAPVAPAHVVYGRDTGYPAGLSGKQSFRVVHVGGRYDPGGTWTVQAKGTGAVRIEHATVGKNRSLTARFRKGRTSTPTFVHDQSAAVVNWVITVMESDPADPLHDLRVIAAEPEGYRGPSFASLYEANAGDPGYFLWHPSYLDFYRPFAVCRLTDVLNVNDSLHPSPVAEWSDRPQAVQGPGFDKSSGLAVEPLVDFGNILHQHLWFTLPHRATDDYLAKLATYLRDHLDPGLKVYAEWSNEVWNWSYGVKRWAFARWAEELFKVASLVRDGSTATAKRAAHGLRPGDPVLITGAAQPEYNGEFKVASTPDADTFSFEVPGSPASPATPLADQQILAFKADALAAKVSSLTFTTTATESSIRLGIDPSFLPGYKLAGGDLLALCNCADPLANGIYAVDKVSADSVTLYVVPCQLRPLPGLSAGKTEIKAAPGLGLMARLVGSNGGGRGVQTAGVPQADDGAARWSGRRHRQAHEIMAAILGDRLVRTVGGWAIPGPIFNKSALNQYKIDAGGRMPPGVQLAIGPYLYKDPGGVVNVRDVDLTGVVKVCILDAAGGLATATCAGHGYRTGDSVQISNAAQPEYCGIFPVTRVDDDRFTYPISGDPGGPGKPLGGNSGPIRCVKEAPWFRELASLSVSGGVAFGSSKGHGFETGDQVKVCNARQPEYNRLAWVRKIDADRFSFYVDGGHSGAATAPDNQRIWAYRASAMDGIFAAMEDQLATVLPARLAALHKDVCDPDGVALSCYESGQHLLPSGQGSPPLSDVFVECNRDPRMGSIYDAYYRLLETWGVKAANHYSSVGGWSNYGSWSLIEYQGQPAIESPKYRALLDLLAIRAALTSEGGYSPPTPRASPPGRPGAGRAGK